MVQKTKRAKKKSGMVKENTQGYYEWHHPGGKLLHVGSEKLSDSELLSILIATGVKGKSAECIAEEIMERFGSFKGLANQPFEKLQAMKGLGKVKTIRIAAAFEIARRIVKETKKSI